MAPHLTAEELDVVSKMQHRGQTPIQIHSSICSPRVRKDVDSPTIQVIYRALRGATHRRGAGETRGRKCKWTNAQARKAFAVREDMIKKAKGEKEIHWSDIVAKARLPKVDSTTAARSMARTNLPMIQARRPREKPLRTEEHDKEREIMGKALSKNPPSFFTKLALIMDNKKFRIPRTVLASRYARMRKVRFHLPTRAEGLIS